MSWFEVLVSLVAGGVLGLLYFGGLWWTVHKVQKSNRPILFYSVSFATRLILIATCLILLLQVGSWHLLISLAGFYLARLVLVYQARPVAKDLHS